MSESIHITISHPTLSGRIAGYYPIWAFFVRGFKATEHCQYCFKGAVSPQFNSTNAATGKFAFEMQSDEILYLCGVAGRPTSLRGERNMHLPLRFAPGRSDSFTTHNGYRFSWVDAELLPIPEKRPREHLRPEQYNCANFRFAESWFGEAARRLG